MNLVWHIVRKDFRRLRWPLGLWLLLPSLQWLLLAKTNRTPMDLTAFDGMITMSGVWVGLTWAVGLILAAWLVMEDGLVSTQAFWRTRPIYSGRLLAAKVLGAVLMFSVLPALVMVPFWLADGFSARELALAALGLASKQGVFTVVAFVLASVTETAGQFLVRLIGIALLTPLTLGYCAGIFDGALGYDGNGLSETRYRLVLGVLALMPLAIVLNQYLTLRRSRSYVLLGVGVALMFALRLGWQWDLTACFRKFPAEETTRSREIIYTPGALGLEQLPEKPAAKLLLQGKVSGAPAGTYLRLDSMRGWWNDSTGPRPGAKFSLEAGASLEVATRQVAGLVSPPAAPLSWQAFAVERDETLAQVRTNSNRYQIAVTAIPMRGRVVGELPLREGAELQSGSSCVRIIGLERNEGRFIVWLEERTAWPPWSWAERLDDGFLLFNPAATPEVIFPSTAGGRPLEFNFLSLRQRQLIIEIPRHEVNGRIVEVPGWEETAKLVRVCFTPEERFTRVLPVDLPAVAVPAP